MTAAIACKQLSCGYHDKSALSGVDFDLRPKAVTALLGPNGSGKSALLKTICKVLPTISGDVEIDGKSVADYTYRELARKVAYVPQEESTPFPFLVRDIVTMGRIPQSTGLFDTEEDRAAAHEAMVSAQCEALADRPVTELSGGEKQRVFIARALAQKAGVLLLDEPTSHLDIAHQLSLLDLVRRLADAGNTLLVAIHDLNLAASMADEGILLSNSQIALKSEMPNILASSLLDEAYGVTFERTKTGTGPLRVFARREIR